MYASLGLNELAHQVQDEMANFSHTFSTDFSSMKTLVSTISLKFAPCGRNDNMAALVYIVINGLVPHSRWAIVLTTDALVHRCIFASHSLN